jgi:hypothetical protein
MSKGNQYYGGFFWVAAVSFVVPLVVAAAAFQDIKPTTKPTPTPDISGVDPLVWDYLLKSYVSNGLVDYKGMRKDYLFHDFVRQLGAAKPDALPTDDAKLALACNAYNAFVINGVISHKINDSVDGFAVNGVGFFDIKEHIFAGKTISLNQLEHEMIRPVFNDPRIHVALVCAAKSCPAIRGEAYIADRVQQQLQDQSEQFANSRTYVEFKPQAKELYLSRILSWYGDDWNQKYPQGGYLQWIKELVDDPQTAAAVDQAIQGDVAVKFFDYDWTLNTQAEIGAHTSEKRGGGFGSGSIPNE